MPPSPPIVPTSALPTTRLLRQQRSASGWGLGVGLAFIINIAVVTVLVQVSQLALEPPLPLGQVERIRTVEPPETEPSPVETVSSEAEPEPISEPAEIAPAVPVAIPALELGRTGTDASFSLPELPLGDDLTALPLSVPRFTSITTVAPPEIPAVATTVIPAKVTLEQRPSVQGTFELDRFFPRAARLGRIGGVTTLLLEIDAQGVVRSVNVLTSSPPGIFEDAARKAVSSMRFKPAERDGQPVTGTLRLALDWKLGQ